MTARILTEGKPLRLLLVRHGATDWNEAGRYQGQADVPLNATGHQQARRLGAALADVPLTALYTSDLPRTYQTAQAIAAHHALTPQPDARLREPHYGQFQGLTYAQMQALNAAAFRAWYPYRHRPPPGGEPVTAVVARINAFLTDITRQPPGATVAAVSHGELLQTLLCVGLGRPLADYRTFEMGNASVSEVAITQAGVTLVRVNDRRHLAE
jgi:2,3-bisphosphoglycerate-dependent phosphoglycerate mutase